MIILWTKIPWNCHSKSAISAPPLPAPTGSCWPDNHCPTGGPRGQGLLPQPHPSRLSLGDQPLGEAPGLLRLPCNKGRGGLGSAGSASPRAAPCGSECQCLPSCLPAKDNSNSPLGSPRAGAIAGETAAALQSLPESAFRLPYDFLWLILLRKPHFYRRKRGRSKPFKNTKKMFTVSGAELQGSGLAILTKGWGRPCGLPPPQAC